MNGGRIMFAKRGSLFQLMKAGLALSLWGVSWLASGQPVSPELSIQLSGGNVVISWTGQGFWLQAADALGSLTPWYNNTQWTVAQSGGAQFSASTPPAGQSRFFRLVASPALPPPTG